MSSPGQDQLVAEPPAAHPLPGLRVILAAPRGFCAGVERAIAAVEDALIRFGAPVYVRRPIVHNRTVMRTLEAKGAVFVEELDEVPAGAILLLIILIPQRPGGHPGEAKA